MSDKKIEPLDVFMLGFDSAPLATIVSKLNEIIGELNRMREAK